MRYFPYYSYIRAFVLQVFFSLVAALSRKSNPKGRCRLDQLLSYNLFLVLSAGTVLRLFEFREKAATEEKKRVRELQERYEERMRSFGVGTRRV